MNDYKATPIDMAWRAFLLACLCPEGQAVRDHRPLIEAAIRSAEAREAARLRSALNDTARRWHGGEHHGPAGVFEECLNPVCIRNLPLMAGGVSRALTVDVGAVTPPPVATLGEAMGVMDADEAATLRRLSVKP